MKALVLSVPLLLSACATGPWTDFFGDTQSATIPRDVRGFVIDAQGCGHFSGEEPYDAERAAQIKDATDMMCGDLEKRHLDLVKRYAGNAQVAALIAEAWAPFE